MNKKWWTVLCVTVLQLGQFGEPACFIQWRCLFRPICPVHSWRMSEAWACVRFVTSWSHFLEGVVLSMCHCLTYLGKAFHHQSHLFWTLAFWYCHSADMLWGKLLCRDFGSRVLALDWPLAACFASASAFSFGVKSMWPGTHWSLILTIPHVFAIRCSPACQALRKSARFCAWSCFGGVFWLLCGCDWVDGGMGWCPGC